ncbi:GNAT family N-acetyltransferase [Aquimarina gracilis]|uniref:GNAT family N-acetyltransferase n=1 Tax=Aquimarina gracilis TaxID=874422 RepID=A0ABU5ZS81_9FLAO|nr:GNAT family N-acetyltransferase [Aquimarina gracilis]MEB3344936.1 GNAT family N-acetyltransferase [Aquimarina gracilis]
MGTIILETERLCLREFHVEDADFILKLVNSPNWIKFIGDKGVKTIEDAISYLVDGPIKSYKENGFGLWLVQLRDSKVPIGMCGLVNREILEDVDIGFALLPDYMNKGYGFESANAVMNYAKNVLKISRIVAITDEDNTSSIKLLQKLGLSLEKKLVLSDADSVFLFSPSDNF